MAPMSTQSATARAEMSNQTGRGQLGSSILFLHNRVETILVVLGVLFRTLLTLPWWLFRPRAWQIHRGQPLAIFDNAVIRLAVNLKGAGRMATLNDLAANCQRSQEALLQDIMRKNQSSQFGRQYAFESIDNAREYQRRVPIHNYSDLEPYIERACAGQPAVLTVEKPFMYATTSGTTGQPKFIPVTATTAKRGHQLIADVGFYFVQANFPYILAGKILTVVSPAVEGLVDDGTPFGSTSGHMIENARAIVKKKAVVPSWVFAIEDYSARYYIILLLAIRQPSITYLCTANPSTILTLCQKLDEWRDDLIADLRQGSIKVKSALDEKQQRALERIVRPAPKRADYLASRGRLHPADLWPHLCGIGCWKAGNAGTFLSAIKPYFEADLPVWEIGYLSSEFRGSVPIGDGTQGGLLATADNFLEFCEVEEWDSPNEPPAQLLLAHQLQVGKCYYIFVTNSGGLYRYHMNDIVRVTGMYKSIPMIEFRQKGKGVTNITGEKIYESQVIEAVEQAKKDTRVPLSYYLAYANYQRCYYEVLAEFDDPVSPEEQGRFIDLVEDNLQCSNIEYQSKRSSLRLQKMQLTAIPKGSYEQFKIERVRRGQREGQFKTVFLTSDEKVRSELGLAVENRP